MNPETTQAKPQITHHLFLHKKLGITGVPYCYGRLVEAKYGGRGGTPNLNSFTEVLAYLIPKINPTTTLVFYVNENNISEEIVPLMIVAWEEVLALCKKFNLDPKWTSYSGLFAEMSRRGQSFPPFPPDTEGMNDMSLSVVPTNRACEAQINKYAPPIAPKPDLSKPVRIPETHRSEWKKNEDQLYFVVLLNCKAQKIPVIKVIREEMGLGLKEAEDLVDFSETRGIFLKGDSMTVADAFCTKLQKAGATASVVDKNQFYDPIWATKQEKDRDGKLWNYMFCLGCNQWELR